MSGLIHIYIGDGKGKTTAAIGLSVRTKGRKNRVIFSQFLKGEDTGELISLSTLNIKIIRQKHNFGFTFKMDENTKKSCKEEQRRILKDVESEISQWGEITQGDIVIFDEVLGALETDMLDDKEFHKFIEKKDPKLELVLTGRNCPGWLLEIADYVTEMKKIKHPYDKGIKARIGIEK
jgi:cob(I)alamin adenosyltransferase